MTPSLSCELHAVSGVRGLGANFFNLRHPQDIRGFQGVLNGIQFQPLREKQPQQFLPDSIGHGMHLFYESDFLEQRIPHAAVVLNKIFSTAPPGAS
jgi:hypothetical protein